MLPKKKLFKMIFQEERYLFSGVNSLLTSVYLCPTSCIRETRNSHPDTLEKVHFFGWYLQILTLIIIICLYDRSCVGECVSLVG